MRFLVTGATGFVGARLVRHLAEAGHEVAGTYIGNPPSEPCYLALEADLLDRRALVEAVERAAPDAVIHLAGLSHVGSSWDRIGDYFRVNVEGTRLVLSAAAGCRFVLASSAEIYGLVPDKDQPIAESTRYDPRNPYAMSKAAAELLALDEGAVVARSFNLIGPGQAEQFALPSFARQLAEVESGEREPVLEVGNLEARRDFLHVDDAMEAYRLMATEGEPGEAYNLGLGEARSIREMLDLLLAVSGVSAHPQMDPERFRPVDIPLTYADTTKLRQLGWRPQHDVEQALRDLWSSVRSARPSPDG
ncbi:MAG: GDP-mannose 4,6-dehydratase [Thermoanaerobaculia bacterium]|nr:GDP-mannose 4,6-dehydratase [Thermoanaerobaculia bacterium]